MIKILRVFFTPIISLFLMGLGIFFQVVRDNLSREFSRKGLEYYRHQKFDQAKRNYQRAIALDLDAKTYYRLGLLYKDLQEPKLAIKEYQSAVQKERSDTLLPRLKAYNNWGHLLIHQSGKISKVYPQIFRNLMQIYSFLKIKFMKSFTLCSTSELMQRFYCELSKGGDQITKTEALRNVQLSLLRKQKSGNCGNNLIDDYSHPYHWVSFILIGNGL